MRRFGYDAALFAALLSTAVALGPALAHLLELPNKIGLAKGGYFTVQQIYRGWSQLGWLLPIQLVSLIAVVLYAKADRTLRKAAVLAVLCLLAAQLLFWVFTHRANVATENWTIQPDDWATLRRRWEFSHAGGAVLQLIGMASLIAGTIGRHRRR
jgi:hypothetical protein